MEGSRYSNRKRSRSHLEVDESVEFEATPAQGSEEFEHIHKKRRTSSPKTVLEAGKHAVKTVYNKFDPKKRSAADDKADELLLELISELKVRVPRK